MNEDMSFQDKMQRAVEHSLIEMLRKGDWLRPVLWDQRLPVDPALIRKCYESVNMDRVAKAIIPKIEDRISDTILNSMATEIATDVKKIMSNQELREDLRAVIRAKIREAEKALSKAS